MQTIQLSCPAQMCSLLPRHARLNPSLQTHTRAFHVHEVRIGALYETLELVPAALSGLKRVKEVNGELEKNKGGGIRGQYIVSETGKGQHMCADWRWANERSRRSGGRSPIERNRVFEENMGITVRTTVPILRSLPRALSFDLHSLSATVECPNPSISPCLHPSIPLVPSVLIAASSASPFSPTISAS